MNYAATAAALVLLVVVGGIAGWAWRDGSARDQIAAAQSATTECANAAAATEARVKELAERYAALMERHQKLRQDADAALAGRDAELDILRGAETARVHSIRGAAHADATCAALARLPVCTAIADQLWPVEAPGSRDTRAND